MSRFAFFLSFFWLFPALADDAHHNPEPFASWLDTFKQEAANEGVSDGVLADAFANTQPLDRVITLDRKQPEGNAAPLQYLNGAITAKRIKDGRQKLKENAAVLEKIGKKYGVQPRFIVALWGIETSYGKVTGGFRTVDALATLAYDGRRSDFFRDELIKALKILEQEGISADELKGSWAGAMGQCQFMPTSFLTYAVDYNGDGKHDIWNSEEDVFASIANYLSTSGWNNQEGWGREVLVPADFEDELLNQTKNLSEWKKLGLRTTEDEPLPTNDIDAKLLVAGEGDDALYFLVYDNFSTLLKWNRSRLFAAAVGTLADEIGKKN